MNLLEKLEKKKDFTSAEAALADYIVNNIDSIYGISLQELAEVSYVSKPTIIRLYRKLGFKNYREFSITLQLEKIRNDDTDIEDSKEFMEVASLYEYAQKIGTLSKQIVDNCIEAIDKDNLEDIVYALLDAKKIFIFADKVIAEEALSFYNHLNESEIDVCLLNKDNAESLESVSEDDVVVIITAGRFSDDDHKILSKLLDTVALKILITNIFSNELSDKVEYSFYTYPNGNDFIRNNVIVSQMSLLMGTNIIYSCLQKLIYDQNKKGNK